jgi:hypothetical protein
MRVILRGQGEALSFPENLFAGAYLGKTSYWEWSRRSIRG